MGTARQRWARVILCLLFALSAILFLGHSPSAQPHPGPAHVEIAADGGDPCEVDHASGVDHCGTTSSCSFCAPLDADWPQLDRTAASPRLTPEAHIGGCVARPHFQPPRLALQA